MTVKRTTVAFVATGAVATAASLAVFRLALAANSSPFAATVIRLAVALPILYLGYSRVMLIEVLRVDRAALGWRRAELRMIIHVALAIGASALLKLIIEPLLTRWLIANWGTDCALLGPLAGELVYGPLATYLVLVARR